MNQCSPDSSPTPGLGPVLTEKSQATVGTANIVKTSSQISVAVFTLEGKVANFFFNQIFVLALITNSNTV